MKKILMLIMVGTVILLAGCTKKEVDNQKPIIIISGGSNAILVGQSFIAPSVHVSDNIDETIDLIVSGDQVDTSQPGTYTILYDAIDASGNQADQKSFTVTVYLYEANMDIVNGGFETGDLTGFTVLPIGDQSDAFSDAFVIDTVNRKEGTYFFDGSKTDDDKVGQLKSSNFVLGGSGWIHFRLGGGNDIDTLYLGVYRTSDDSLVAKFSNRNPQKYGGNEFLVGYKYNLLDVDGLALGESLYIKVVDSKLENWAIIKIDDIKTFNIIEPSSNTYDLAINQA